MGRYPPEWENQSTVWLSWPTYGKQCKALSAASEVIADMAAGLVCGGAVPFVTVLVNGPQEIQDATELLTSRSVKQNQVKFVVVPHREEWIRDFGPIFLKDETQGLQVASFGWNNWGSLDHDLREDSQELCAEASRISGLCAASLNLPIVQSSIVSEGGNREFNGAGVMMATSITESQRNPSITLESIETEFKRIFDVEKVIWLEEGLADDDHTFNGPHHHGGIIEFNSGTTGGHIDEYCKFLGPNKVLLAEVPEEERQTPLGQITHRRMERNLDILKGPSSGTISGEPFEIVRIPTPPTMRIPLIRDDPMWEWLEEIYFENDGHPASGKTILTGHERTNIILPASYVNMIMCNGTILLPRYGRRPDEVQWTYLTAEENARALHTDELAKAILQEHLPTYKIIQISSVPALNLGGGGMHCTSQQQPA